MDLTMLCEGKRWRVEVVWFHFKNRQNQCLGIKIVVTFGGNQWLGRP